MMMRWLVGLMVFLLLPMQITAGQLTTLPEGLVQAVSRTWLAPAGDNVLITIEEINAQGTPLGEPTVIVSSSPVATFESNARQGTVRLSAALFEFESDAAAGDAYAEFVPFMEETVAQDPAFATTDPMTIPLAIGEQSFVVTGAAADAPSRSFLAAVVLDGPWLYVLQGTLVGLDVTVETERLIRPMVETPVDSNPPTFHADGTSTGGIWAKLTEVQPLLVADSVVVDTIILAADR
jgi:hypothetical protein